MKNFINLLRHKHFIILVLTLTTPSLWMFQKRLSLAGGLIYFLLAGSIILVILTWLQPRMVNVQPKYINILSLLTVIGLITTFFLLYPLETGGRFGVGSDRDEALNIAVTELLAGRYPYYAKTHLNGPITPFPGAILLAVPFVILGNSAYQNLFWLAGFYVVLKRWLFPSKTVLLLFFWTILAVSPAFWYEWISGGDLLANNLYVFIFILLTINLAANPYRTPWLWLPAIIFTGLGLSSRPNFLFLVPPLFSAIKVRANFRTAFITTGSILFVFCLVTLPFFLIDPSGFSPLHVLNKFSTIEQTFPYAGVIISGFTLVLSIFLAWRQHHSNIATLCYDFALIQAFPLISGVILNSIQTGYPNFSFIADRLGLNFMFFGAVAAWCLLTKACSSFLVRT
ncbi:MAG: hypothetical protein D6681_10075 [Calditrichaeota bacterium]|nr:MAG: hypothetical protein D6681_10075 [Calditrichota bacterium]